LALLAVPSLFPLSLREREGVRVSSLRSMNAV
jgi:hypothetical protein